VSQNPATVIQQMAQTLVAMDNCDKMGNSEGYTFNHRAMMALVRNFLPSGSGWDRGTTIEIETSTPNRIMLTGSFHHMDEHGFYTGWTHHTLLITPSLAFGFDIEIDGFAGDQQDNFEDELHDIFHHALSSMVRETTGGWVLAESAKATD